MKKKFYLTTPLYYVNAQPHIGHSYTNIASDCFARYKRLRGYQVYFLTGTDEHGQKVACAAQEANLTPQDFTNQIIPRFIHLWQRLGISYDDFIRTTEKRHTDTVAEVLKILLKKGDLYLGKYAGWYCTPCETFWQDLQVKDNLCPDCQRPVERIVEENYFFKMSKYQPWLVKYIQAHPNFILPLSRRNEMLSFLLENRLTDLCISRPKQRVAWGIPIPFSPEHVTYVWFDALINYISAPGFFLDKKRFARLWPAELQIIGKDILRQHAVYWPIMLHALDLLPPETIFAHGWWLIKQVKMSKSRGNIVDPEELVNKFGVDALRYFLLREVPFGLDGTYSQEGFINRFNSDLANDLGNLLHRSLTMADKYFSGGVPQPGPKDVFDQPLITEMRSLPLKYFQAMDELEFSLALEAVWVLINSANKYIEDVKPWNLSKENNTSRLASVVYNLVELLRITAILIYPFMPSTCCQILEQLGLDIDLDEENFSDLLLKKTYPVGTKIRRAQPLFPRVEHVD